MAVAACFAGLNGGWNLLRTASKLTVFAGIDEVQIHEMIQCRYQLLPFEPIQTDGLSGRGRQFSKLDAGQLVRAAILDTVGDCHVVSQVEALARLKAKVAFCGGQLIDD